jgi:hypothetical protein
MVLPELFMQDRLMKLPAPGPGPQPPVASPWPHSCLTSGLCPPVQFNSLRPETFMHLPGLFLKHRAEHLDLFAPFVEDVAAR